MELSGMNDDGDVYDVGPVDAMHPTVVTPGMAPMYSPQPYNTDPPPQVTSYTSMPKASYEEDYTPATPAYSAEDTADPPETVTGSNVASATGASGAFSSGKVMWGIAAAIASIVAAVVLTAVIAVFVFLIVAAAVLFSFCFTAALVAFILIVTAVAALPALIPVILIYA